MAEEESFINPKAIKEGEAVAGLPLKVEFYRGIKGIAAFLELHPQTTLRLLKDGKIPAKKDQTGRWVLCNLDYYLSLRKL
jgi:hypothetical protein